MNLKLLKESSLISRGKSMINDRLRMRANKRFLFDKKIKVKKKNLERILISLIVVAMVGGTFFYLFQTRNFERTVLGGILSSLTFVSQDKEEETEVEQETEGRWEYQEEYKEIALQGDGLTHVARRVLDRHIEEKGITDLNSEHRIYIEDYVQKKLGSETINLGEEITVSQDLISEAVNSSRELTDHQLNNLSQYTPLVSFYN